MTHAMLVMPATKPTLSRSCVCCGVSLLWRIFLTTGTASGEVPTTAAGAAPPCKHETRHTHSACYWRLKVMLVVRVQSLCCHLSQARCTTQASAQLQKGPQLMHTWGVSPCCAATSWATSSASASVVRSLKSSKLTGSCSFTRSMMLPCRSSPRSPVPPMLNGLQKQPETCFAHVRYKQPYSAEIGQQLIFVPAQQFAHARAAPKTPTCRHILRTCELDF